MFQRLKGAFDSIADLADEPPRTRPARATSQTKLASRTLSPRKNPRPRTPDTSDKTPDPDPATFALDPPTVQGTSVEKTENGEGTSETNTEKDATPQESDDVHTIQGGAVEDSKQRVDDRTVENTEDVKAKLRRLEKLETKYQELLRAYRKAHARNAAIVPFEASLRENTPLTSINDPGALVEYLSQINLKGDMVMDELKRISGENDGLKQKLQEAKQQTKDALDEVTQLKQRQEEAATPQDTDVVADRTAHEDSTKTAPANLDGALETLELGATEPRVPAQPASEHQTISITNDTPVAIGDFGDERVESLEPELSQLRVEVQTHLQSIAGLELERDSLKQDLVAATSSVDSLRQALTISDARVETLASQQFSETELREILEIKQSEVQKLRQELSNANSSTTQDKVDVIPLENAPDDQEEASGSAKKKKNKKKKKKAAPSADSPLAVEPAAVTVATVNSPLAIPAQQSAQLKERDTTIDKLQEKLKNQEGLLEEIEGLRDDLIEIGQEHVEAKDQVVTLQKQNSDLKTEIEALENRLTDGERIQKGSDSDRQQLVDELSEWKTKSSTLQSESTMQVEKLKILEAKIADYEVTKASVEATLEDCRKQWSSEVEEYKAKIKPLEIDASAAQQLAASRYKDLTQARDTLQRLQPEISSLRSEVAELKNTKSELEKTVLRLRRLEEREEVLNDEITSQKRKVLEAEAEIEKLKRETSRQLALEESSRQLQTDLQRVSNEKAEIMAAREDLAEDMKKAQRELKETRSRVRQLEGQIEDSQKENRTIRQEIVDKTAQYDTATRNLSSVRDQAAEMATQMREATKRCEGLEEELTDAHKLMNERAREGETMRRLLGEVEGRAEIRVKELKERMEVLTQERDRAEDEASTIGRRRTRELDDVKVKLRELERELKRAGDDKVDVERKERELRQQIEGDENKVLEALQELTDIKSAMSELRATLDESERQCREMETEKTELKRMFEESQSRLEKAQKSQKAATDEMRSFRATRIRPVGSDSPSTRSSIDSTRIMSPISVGRDSSKFGSTSNSSFGAGGPSSIDYVYLKNVLLQFLEQKDKGHQMQLIPVLSMLLHFDRKDEQRWMTAISAK